MINPPDEFVVRNELVLRLFLLSALDIDDARAVLRPLADNSARELAALRDAIQQADATTPAEAGLPFGRLVAEYGMRSFQTLHDWAVWALARLDQSQEPRQDPGQTRPRR
jgi:hypothetical protein